MSKLKYLLAIAGCATVLGSQSANAEDTDIYVGGVNSLAGNANVLIVLDNTSNWSRASQHWPGGIVQGQAEADAIRTVVGELTQDINMGLMEFVTGSGGGNDGGYIRQAIVPMTPANIALFQARLNTIYGAINDPIEKTQSSMPYGSIMFDAFKYFGGYTSPQHSTDGVAGSPTDSLHFGQACYAASNKVPTSLADALGYSNPWDTFSSPITTSNSCGKNYIIFIGNGWPNADDPTLLSNVGGNVTQIPLPNLAIATKTFSNILGQTSICYASAAACSSGTGAGSIADFSSTCTSYTSCACGTSIENTNVVCTGSDLAYTIIGTKNPKSVRLGYETTCRSNLNQCSTAEFAAQCATYDGGCACSSGDYVTDTCGSNKKRYAIYGTQTTTTNTNLGLTSACYTSQAACTAANSATCGSGYDSCACSAPSLATYQSCAGGGNRYSVVGTNTATSASSTGTYTMPTANNERSADEWAKFLYQTDVSGVQGQQNVVTYTIDVYYADQDANQSALMMNMARAGGGKYFAATSKQAIINALREILAEVQSVNSTFASASLPVSATNRARNENQVYIPMFRPDPGAKPRWFGNLKRYQLANLAGDVDLADKDGLYAINTQTGFVAECATSWWTSDSPLGTTPQTYYWENWLTNPIPASACPSAANKLSDAPDGPFVEKGAAAEVLRKGNNPPATDGTPTWNVSRNIYSLKSGVRTAFDTTNFTTADFPVLTPEIVNFVRGEDRANEDVDINYTETRPAIHGDVIHSRPLPVNYGANGITVFYGANDGTLRALEAETGRERWAFVAPEFFSRLGRLKDNCPLINYPTLSAGMLNDCDGDGLAETPIRPKDYFFDGSIGWYQNTENTQIWLYPSMRRGGRMVYAFDVTDPATPGFKWRKGCPNLTDDTGCDSGMSGIGQTWSLPNVAFIKGYSTSTPIVTMGGGYDSCEDADTTSPSCGSAKGRGVYVLDGDDGTLIKSFTTTRSVAADVAYVDVDHDGMVDYAYAADAGGNIYRVNFVNPETRAPLASSDWQITRVAYTGGGRKFLFAPALVHTRTEAGKDYVYVVIGSGDREHPLSTQYPYTSVTNQFFVYLDDVTSNTAINLDSADVSLDCTNADDCIDKPLLPEGTKRAWHMALNQYGTGEQTVTSPLVVGGQVAFSTNRPIPPAENTCTAILGEARGYWVDLLTSCGTIGATDGCVGGRRSSTFVGGGLPPSPVIGTVTIDGKPTTVVIGAVKKEGIGVDSPISGQKPPLPIKSIRKRVYWYTKGDN